MGVIFLLLLCTGCNTPPRKEIPLARYEGLIRVACIGDNITKGAETGSGAQDAYPTVLSRLLGPAYVVRNFGVSNATLLKQGDQPYWDAPEFRAATDFGPHVVVILLGANDSKPQNWRFADAFERDYYSLVRHFQGLYTQPIVYLCTPLPVFQERSGIRAEIVDQQIAPRIRRLGIRETWPVIDLRQALDNRADLFPDGLHPNAAGAASVADTVDAGLRGR